MTSKGTGISILLVEDDPLLAATVRRSIEKWPEQPSVQTAETCMEAESAWLSLAPDFALIDYRLPDGFGTDVLQNIRQQGLQTPVVCMTAESEQIPEKVCRKLSITEVLGKPVDLRLLHQHFKNATERAESSSPQQSKYIGRFRQIRIPGMLSEERVQTILRAAAHELWVALELNEPQTLTNLSIDRIREWAASLSKRGGRLCILAKTDHSHELLDKSFSQNIDVFQDTERLQAQGMRLTGNAERKQILDISLMKRSAPEERPIQHA